MMKVFPRVPRNPSHLRILIRMYPLCGGGRGFMTSSLFPSAEYLSLLKHPLSWSSVTGLLSECLDFQLLSDATNLKSKTHGVTHRPNQPRRLLGCTMDMGISKFIFQWSKEYQAVDWLTLGISYHFTVHYFWFHYQMTLLDCHSKL